MSTSDINTLSEKKMILVLLSVSGETLWVDACGSTLENWVNTVKYEKVFEVQGHQVFECWKWTSRTYRKINNTEWREQCIILESNRGHGLILILS